MKNLQAKVQEVGKRLSMLRKNITAWTNQAPTKGDWKGVVQGMHTLGADVASLRGQVGLDFGRVYRVMETTLPHPSESEGPKPPPSSDSETQTPPNLETNPINLVPNPSFSSSFGATGPTV